MKMKIFLMLAGVALLASLRDGHACTNLIVTRGASSDGS